MSRTPFVPTVELSTGLPPFRKRKLVALFPSDRCHCTLGSASLNVEMR